MNELKRGNEVEYEVPDVNENYPGRDIEVRVYLLRAFQISPTQVRNLISVSLCICCYLPFRERFSGQLLSCLYLLNTS